MAYHISKGMTKTSPLVTYIFRKYRQITVYILITCVVGVNVYVNNSTCVTDVERVPYCPATEEKWRMAAERKNCSSKIPECPYTDPLKYHCLINAWRNETYELCGVDTEIIGFSCAEYNAGGKKIQPNYASRCEYFDPGCPFKYNSSTGYFYPKCYQILQNDHIVVEALSTRQPDDTTVVNVTSAQPDDTTVVNVTTSPSEDETSPFAIAAPLLLVFLLIVMGIPLYIKIKKILERRMPRNDERETTEDTPMVETV